MTEEQMRELVKECGLDWHRGYMPLFDGDPTNRYAVLIEAATAAERERAAKVCENVDLFRGDRLKNSDPRVTCAAAIRAR